jgi:hypothetical protein
VILISAVSILAAQNPNTSTDSTTSNRESSNSESSNSSNGDAEAVENDGAGDYVDYSDSVVKVDYDSNQDLRAEYGVTQQTTFVEVDSSGKKLQDNFVAYSDPTLQTVLNALL